jgi:uncharacterized protein
MSEPHEHHHHHHEPVEYRDVVEQMRAEKDEFFRTDPQSPVPVAERRSFAGLPYFPVDEALRFEGVSLEPNAEGQASTLTLPTTDGRERHAHRAGRLSFELAGERRNLTAFLFEGDEDEASLFVPFLDATSGRESYGAGRYLDLYPEEDGTYALDFNLAYHPSCVYDPKYSCPLTPPENRLPVRIEAGERLAEDHASAG